MPKKARIDAPGVLHHITARGIERRLRYKDDTDCENFLTCLIAILLDTRIAYYAWALMPNHFHLLLRTGSPPPIHARATIADRVHDIFQPPPSMPRALIPKPLQVNSVSARGLPVGIGPLHSFKSLACRHGYPISCAMAACEKCT